MSFSIKSIPIIKVVLKQVKIENLPIKKVF